MTSKKLREDRKTSIVFIAFVLLAFLLFLAPFTFSCGSELPFVVVSSTRGSFAPTGMLCIVRYMTSHHRPLKAPCASCCRQLLSSGKQNAEVSLKEK